MIKTFEDYLERQRTYPPKMIMDEEVFGVKDIHIEIIIPAYDRAFEKFTEAVLKEKKDPDTPMAMGLLVNELEKIVEPLDLTEFQLGLLMAAEMARKNMARSATWSSPVTARAKP